MQYPSFTDYCDLHSLTLTRYEENQEYFIIICSGAPFFKGLVVGSVLQEYPHARLVKIEDALLEFNLGTAFDLIKNPGSEIGFTSSMTCAIAPPSEEENQ